MIRQKITSKFKHRRYVFRHFFLDLADSQRPVFLAGVGRSGTTWVAEIINYKHHYRYMFEPFHPIHVPASRRFGYGRYLRPDQTESHYLKTARAILAGNIRNPRIDRFNTSLLCRNRLIKEIHANLYLKWIHAQFPHTRIILLLRHPCAVALSKLRLKWPTYLDAFLTQDTLMIDHLGFCRAEMEGAANDFEKHVFTWCIENYVPLKQFSWDEILVLFYETLCVDARAAIGQLFAFIGATFDGEVLANLSRPSQMSREGSAFTSRGSLVDAWRKEITQAQLRKCMDILSLFGLDKLYGEGVMPDSAALRDFLRPA